MRSFIALVWNPRDPAASRAAEAFDRSILVAVGPEAGKVTQAGFVLHDLSLPAGNDAIIRLGPDGVNGTGAIFGTLFQTSGGTQAAMRVTALDAACAAALARGGAPALLAQYWGRYVAFLKTGDGFAIIPDPAASIPCYYTRQSGVTVIFSNLEKCNFLDRSGFTINYAFVSALLAYDKIQNGDTGLNEIGELAGGQQLRVMPSEYRIDTVWDPRNVALSQLDLSPDDAATRLRETVLGVTHTWAREYGDVAVSLSGGLDSSIVLNSLARNDYPGALSAVHFQPDSADGSELRYACAAAEQAGCKLVTIPVSPGAGLPGVGEHPLTARPQRQFLAPDLPSLLPALPAASGALFTGQGGDHLFRVARAPTAFADYIRQSGLSREAGAILLDSARLSGQSIWSVLKHTTPLIAGRGHVSDAVAGLDRRRTRVNQHVLALLDPERVLPVWARESGGLPPAKFDQVSTLVHMFQVRDHLDSRGDRDIVRPLMSQPLIELCLRLPAWILSAGGVNRGLARRAFRGIVPDLVLERTTKGYAARYYVDRVSAWRQEIIETLANGELAARDLISSADIQALGEREQLTIQASGSRMLMYYGIESWLRAWTRETQKPSSAAAPTGAP
tara:strand:+ start:8358 stop:10211 length:1854 start_codon:yes stop_codon:yes gene_type:complete